jgi:PAS domain S-box-containing protein
VTTSAWEAAPLLDPGEIAKLQTLVGSGFDHSAFAMLLVNDNVQTVCANPAAGRLFGSESSALVGYRNADFAEVEWTADGDRQTVAFRLGDLNHLERETEVVTAAGDQVRGKMMVDVITTDGGRRYFLLQLRDVTEDRDRSAALAASEMRYRLLVANLPQAAIFMFDHELRLQLAVGESLADNGYDEGRLTGGLLSEVLPLPVVDLLAGPYRAALAGRPSDFEYTSPVHGGQFRMRVRPVAGPDGRIMGGLAISEDVSGDRARESRLRQIHGLTPFGSCQYDIRSGWVFDRELLELWGVDAATEPLAVINELVLPEDRAVTTSAWAEVLARGGRSSPQYRIRHGQTDELRFIKSTCEAEVNGAGVLLRAISTHVDVSDAIAARVVAEHAEAAAAEDRSMLRRVNDAVATTNSGLGELTRSMTSPSASDVGPDVPQREMTQDQRTVEFGVVAHRDEERRLASEPGFGLHGDIADDVAIGGGAFNGSSAFHEPLDERIDGEARHFIVAPVRHGGAVLGLLSIFRAPDTPYQLGDEQPIQLQADRVGSALAESRLREVRDQERVERRAVADRLLELTYEQRELLEQLASTETRERALLADAVHDDPMQMIVAAILRIDYLRLRVVGDPGDELERIATLLETSVERLRKLIVAITPPDLSDGLGVALHNLAEGIFIGTTSAVTVIGPTHVSLNPPATATAYRIMREALVNARKHAQAGNVTLRLEEHEGSVMLSLTDDGVGAASLKAEPGHFGLATMRARANAEDAQLHIDSTPGLGTTVVLTMPMTEEPAR